MTNADKKLLEELEQNKKKHFQEFKKFMARIQIDGYKCLLDFNQWYEVWMDSGHWEERKEYMLMPQDGELVLSKETAMIVPKGHYEIMDMVKHRAPYEDIDKFIAKEYEE